MRHTPPTIAHSDHSFTTRHAPPPHPSHANPTPPFHAPHRYGITVDLSAGGAFFLPFWALYGFFEPGELAATPGSSSIAPLVLWVYLMVALVLFVNLLIAMFNKSFQVRPSALESRLVPSLLIVP